jgi:hypothetical protein
MVCVVVPLLLKRNIGVLFGVLRNPRSDVPFFLACFGYAIILKKTKKLNSVAVVRKRTIPSERPPLVGEVSVNLCG